MSEANNHATSFNSQSNFESVDQSPNEQQQKVTETSHCDTAKSYLPLDTVAHPEVSQLKDAEKIESEASLGQKMNWQKVAHKLREYNRKLLKQVFRLEQELAEIDNKYNKYVEKSQTSDLLVAQQAEEIKTYQEQIAAMSQQLTNSQQQIESRETVISNLSQQYELSQKQTAQLERECTLLQENYAQQACELAAKVKETKELQTKLNQQQRYALQYKAELKRQIDKPPVLSTVISEPVVSHSQSYANNRSIKPWSTSRIPEPKISLPQTAKIEREPLQPSLKISQKAGEIDTWSSVVDHHQVNQPAVKSTQKQKQQKPQSLAAVDLPTFPRSS
jgi:chromosome segregation ATPase